MSLASNGKEQPLYKAVFGVLICALLWGSTFPSIKTVYGAWEAQGLEVSVWRSWWFAGVRMSFAGLLLMVIARNWRQEFVALVQLGKWPWLLALSLLQTFFQYALFYLSLKHGSSTLVSLLTSTGSFWWLLLAPLFGKGSWAGWRSWVVLCFGAVGVSVAVWGSGPASARPVLATALVLGANLCGALALLIFGKVRVVMGARAATGSSLFFGGVLLCLLGAPAASETGQLLSGSSWIFTIHLSLVSAIAFSLWNELSTRYPVSLLATFRFLIPLMGMIESVLLLSGERFTPELILGALLVILAMILAARLPQKTQPKRVDG